MILEIKKHFEKLEYNKMKIKPVIFVDDMDYYEKYWITILNTITDFIVSPKSSVVIAARPLLKE